jgi:uncharacterized membrane protein
VTRSWLASLRAWPAYRWILLMAAVYFVAAFFGTWINYIDLHFNTLGIYDLSINQQALASTAHGNYPFPFYEASNCGRNLRCSFLQVHPIFLAYLVVLPYSLVPSAATLFAIQDVGLALATVPLFLLSREITKSTRLAILTTAIYLVWLPAFSGVFSFHWEAFIPVEFFTIFYLWLRERYVLAIPVAILTYVTLEIGSVFLFCLAVFFLYPWAGLVLNYVRARWNLRSWPAGPRKVALAESLHRVRQGLFRPTRVRASLALLVGSVFAYVALHEFVTRGGWLLGLPPLPAQYQIPLSQPVYAATFTLQNFLFHWPQKVIFWLVMFGTLGAIPLLAPRTAILWGPWVAYTTVTTAGFYHMGNQYGFLAAAVMFPGFLYGLVRLQRWADGTHLGSLWTRFWKGGDPVPARRAGVTKAEPSVSRSYAQALAEVDRAILRHGIRTGTGPRAGYETAPAPTVPLARQPTPTRPPPSWTLDRRRRHSWQIIGVVATGIVVFNLALNPLIPYTAWLRADRPFAAQSNLGITGLPDYAGYNEVKAMLALIPSRAVVAVSPALLTLLSNDPNAYGLLNNVHWPVYSNYTAFNATLPQYVLLVIHGSTYIPGWLKSNQLYTPGNLTVLAWAPSTYLGGMILFERNYTGPVETFGADAPFVGSAYNALSGIVAKPAGTVTSDPSAPFGAVVSTRVASYSKSGIPVFTKGRVVQTPPVDLAPGNYSITVELTGSGNLPGSKQPSINVSELHLAAFEYPISHQQESYANMTAAGGWTVTMTADLTGPVLNFEVIGTNEQTWFNTTVYSITVTPEG